MSGVLSDSQVFEDLQKTITEIKKELSELEDKMDGLSNSYYKSLLDLQKVCPHNMVYNSVYECGEYFCTICMLTSRVKIDNKNDAK